MPDCCEDQVCIYPQRHDLGFTMTCRTCGKHWEACLGGGWQEVAPPAATEK